jgi:hypothetical protein
MEKIKSVRLKKYPEVELFREDDDYGKTVWKSILGTVKLSDQRLEDFKDSLEIEYEQERKYIDVRIEVAKHRTFFSDKRCTELGCKKIENFIKEGWAIDDAKVTKLGEGTL